MACAKVSADEKWGTAELEEAILPVGLVYWNFVGNNSDDIRRPQQCGGD